MFYSVKYCMRCAAFPLRLIDSVPIPFIGLNKPLFRVFPGGQGQLPCLLRAPTYGHGAHRLVYILYPS